MAATLSLAGRTEAPAASPLPSRVGGFGGVEGLVAALREARFDAVVDATHPFAARISANARAACGRLGLPLATFTRPPWTPEPGDRWQAVPDLAAAVAALGDPPRRVFLTIGRLGLAAFRAAPQHDYLIRTIDPPADDALPPRNTIVLGRGPFDVAAEAALMRRHRINILVTKNSGGTTSAGKLEAARRAGRPVILVEPPPRPAGTTFFELADILGWIAARHRSAP